MRRLQVFACLGVAVLWLASGAGLATRLHAANSSTVWPAVASGQVPEGLTPSDWQTIHEQVAKLVAADGAGDEQRFGRAVSISGNTALVGAFAADVGDNSSQGAAYIFYRDQGGPDSWGQVAKLTAADGAFADWFGYSVSISGDAALIGAPTADVAENNQGAAYIFYRNQGGADAWGQVAKLTASDGVSIAQFGQSVSLSGSTAIVGAPWATVNEIRRGAAYVFYRAQGGADAWGQVAKLAADDGIEYEMFGDSVSISGDTAVIGAPSSDVGSNANQGAAYVFYRNQGGADTWGQISKLTAADGAAEDAFSRVSNGGDTIIVGASGADVGSNTDQGAAYVFYRHQGGADAWGQVSKLTAADGETEDYFGVPAVSVTGDTAVIRASSADIGSNANQGAAYVFHRNQSGVDAWGQLAKLVSDDGAAADGFGVSVSVSTDTALVGAWAADIDGTIDQGAAYVFALDLPQHTVYLPLVIRSYTSP